VVVHWVLLAAPSACLRSRSASACTLVSGGRVLFQYVAFVSLVIIGERSCSTDRGAVGRVPVRRFAVEIAPVQVVAASTQSSLATLPAMIECARDALGVPRASPASSCRWRRSVPLHQPDRQPAVCFFIAALYGFEPGALQMVTAIVVAFAVSVAAVGLPARCRSSPAWHRSASPRAAVELLGILIAVEIVPDIFRTIGNVTGDLAVATMVQSKRNRERISPRPESEQIGFDVATGMTSA